jgi:hypothetical protein
MTANLIKVPSLHCVALDERVARIEGVPGQMGKNLNHIEREIVELRREMNGRFLWPLGVQISTRTTVMLALLRTA